MNFAEYDEDIFFEINPLSCSEVTNRFDEALNDWWFEEHVLKPFGQGEFEIKDKRRVVLQTLNPEELMGFQHEFPAEQLIAAYDRLNGVATQYPLYALTHAFSQDIEQLVTESKVAYLLTITSLAGLEQVQIKDREPILSDSIRQLSTKFYTQNLGTESWEELAANAETLLGDGISLPASSFDKGFKQSFDHMAQGLIRGATIAAETISNPVGVTRVLTEIKEKYQGYMAKRMIVINLKN